MGKTKIVVNIHMKVDTVPQLLKALRKLERREVVVGYPEDKNKQRENSDSDSPTNAELAFWFTKGDPLKNQDPRPFLEPGIEEGKDKITAQLKLAGKAALDGNPMGTEQALIGSGLAAVSAVKNKLESGPFKKLADSTLKRRKTRKIAPRTGEKPGIDTAQMLNATNFAVRDRKA